MGDPGGYHDDDFEAERDWRRELGDALAIASTALIVVGAIAAVGWVWMAARSQGLIGGEELTSDFSAAQRIDFLVGTLDRLVMAVLAITIGLALRRHAERDTA